MPKSFRFFLLALIAALALGIAACGDDDDGGGGGSSDTASKDQGKAIKAGVVTDIGGLNDRSFNFLANKGLEDAEGDLGVEGRVLISKSNGDYVPNLSTLAQQQYDLSVGVGFLMADAVATVAGKFPKNNFAIVDFPASGLKGKPQNVEGLLFKEQEAGYLAGYLAGLWAKDNNATTVSTVGGQKIPPVDHYIAGFQEGAKNANPGIKTLNGYSQDFVDQAKCKEIALDQIAQGSKVVFQVAGQCGLGALDAAKEKGVQGIGVDADQAYLGDHILTSALKKVDVAVFDAIKRAQDGKFKGGTDVIATVENGGVGLGQIGPAGTKYEAQIEDVTGQARRRRDQGHSRHGQVARSAVRSTRARATRNNEEVRSRRRERRDQLRPSPRRGPRTARRERGWEVHPDVDPLRALQPDRGRDSRQWRAGRGRVAVAGDRTWHRHGPPALHARAGDDRDREHRPGGGAHARRSA